MSESDDMERLREQRRRELADGVAGGESSTGDDGDGAPDEPVHVESAEHLEELAGRYDVVLTDFYADWCGPCRMIEPVVEEIAAETDAAVAKVDIDVLAGLAQRYGVQGVPTLLLFADGEPAERVVGARGKDELVGLVRRYA